MISCAKCAQSENCIRTSGMVEILDVGCKYGTYKPRTEGDRVRAMTDEELAELLCDHSCFLCPIAQDCEGRMEVGRDACKKRWLNWLREATR